MTSKDWIDLAGALAWPVVASAALVYVWRSDAIGRLIKIADSVKELNGRLVELVEAEQRLTQTSGAIREVTANLNQVQEDFLSLKADIENIRDKVDQFSEPPAPLPNAVAPVNLQGLFNDMDREWQSLVDLLQERFGWFDGRSVAAAVRSFAHGNRKGAKLSYEQADAIARLHSSIKSYRRRQAYLEDWLNLETHDAFIASCEEVKAEIA